MSCTTLNAQQQRTLRQLAVDSVEQAFTSTRPVEVNPQDYDDVLRSQRCCFVTWKKQNRHCGELRGCIGALETDKPLIENVAYYAYAAAFQDPRFSSINAREWPTIDGDISVLTEPCDQPIKSYEQLEQHLRVGIDGLILQEGLRKATFLPSVWQELPKPSDFINHLLQKGGWPVGYWSDQMSVQTYQAELIPINKASLHH